MLLVPGYYRCPQLCGLVMHGLLDALQASGAAALAVAHRAASASTRPRRRRTRARGATLDLAYADFAAGARAPDRPLDLHLLTLDAGRAARASPARIGVPIQRRGRPDGRRRASRIRPRWSLLTPRGAISRYFNGLAIDPGELRVALADAAGDRLGSATSAPGAAVRPFRSARRARSTPPVMNAVRAGVALLVVGLAAWCWRRRGTRPEAAMNADVDARLAASFRLLSQSASTVAAARGPAVHGDAGAHRRGGAGRAGGHRVLLRPLPPGRAGRAAASVERKLGIELTWTLLPLLLFIGIFVWAAHDFMRMYEPPRDALPVYVVAKQWMWKLQHRSGRREINELHVPLGQPVRLVMTAQDAIHSFYVPAFRLKQDVLPGRYTSLWFTATQLGEFHLFCAEYCGSEHSQMIGRIVVMPPAEYARWVAGGPSRAEPGAVRLRALPRAGLQRLPHAGLHRATRPRCAACSGARCTCTTAAASWPTRTTCATPSCCRSKDVVAGFEPVMPSFAGQVSEEDIQALIAYIRSGAPP